MITSLQHLLSHFTYAEVQFCEVIKMAYIYIEPTERTFAKAYRVFYGNAYGTFTIDIGKEYPNVDKSLLTSEDFICSYMSDSNQIGRTFGNGGRTTTYYSTSEPLSITPSYDAETGILTVNFSTGLATYWKNPETSGASGFSGLTLAIYMIVDGIRNEYT